MDSNRDPRRDLNEATTAELVATLESPNGWHRDTAARLLFEQQDKSAIPLLINLAGTFALANCPTDGTARARWIKCV